MPNIPITLSLSSATVATKADGKKVIGDYRPTTFDLTKPTKLKKALTAHLHSMNIWEDGRIGRCVGVTGLQLDYDDSASLTELQERFRDYRHVIYSSTNHTDEAPKFHVLLPFDPGRIPAFPEQADALYAWCREQQKEGLFVGADRCFDAGRKFFPHCTAEAKAKFRFVVNVQGTWFPIPDVSKAISAKSDAMSDVPPEQYVRERTQHIRDLWETTESVARTQDAFKLALDCKRRGLSRVDARAQLWEWVQKQSKSRDKPYPKHRLEAEVLSAYDKEYPYQPPPERVFEERPWGDSTDRVLDSAQTPDDAEAQEDDDPDAGVPLTEAELLGVAQLRKRVVVGRRSYELTDRTLRGEQLLRYRVSPQKRIGRLFWENRLTMYWGPEKQGKTRLLHADVLDIVQREPGNCLWVSSDESANDIVERVQRDGLCERVDLLYRPRSFDEVLVSVFKHRPLLLVVDSLGSVLMTMGIECPQSHDKEGWQAVVDPYRALIERSSVLAVVFTDHAIRDGSRYSGSAGKGAAVDVLVGMEANKSRDFGKISIIGRVPEDGTEEAYRYRPDVAGGSYDVSRDIAVEPDERATLDKLSNNDRILCHSLAKGQRLDRKQIVALLGVRKQALSKMKSRLAPDTIRIEKTDSNTEVWYMSEGQATRYRAASGSISELLDEGENMKGSQE